MENYFVIFGIFRRKYQRETVSEVATRQGGAHTPWARLALSWATRKVVDALIFPQQSKFYEKNLGERFTPIGVTDLRI